MNKKQLKQILFLFTETYYNEITPQMQELKKAALTDADDRIEISITSCANSKDRFLEIQLSLATAQQTLIVTDSSQILNYCIQQGFYAIALYHEHNRQENFSATPYAIEDPLSMTYDSYLKAYQRLAGLPWDILQTQRLSLRESTVADVNDFYRIYQGTGVTQYIENLFENYEEECAYIKEYIQKIYGFYGFGMWTVIHTASHQVIGRAGLGIREGYELPELGFVTDVSFQKQGYTYEICQAILQYAFHELEFPQIQAFCNPANTASAHLLKKLGLTYKETVPIDGILHERYEISAS